MIATANRHCHCDTFWRVGYHLWLEWIPFARKNKAKMGLALAPMQLRLNIGASLKKSLINRYSLTFFFFF